MTKNEIIDTVIKYLEKCKEFPAQNITYRVMARNSDILDFINESTDDTDPTGKKLTRDERMKVVKDKIKWFENSEEYNKPKPGYSYVDFSVILAVNNITFDKIRELVENPPIDGEFVEFLEGPLNIYENICLESN